MKKKMKKLTLARETLRDLDDNNLNNVAGGDSHRGTIICSACSHCASLCTSCDPETIC